MRGLGVAVTILGLSIAPVARAQVCTTASDCTATAPICTVAAMVGACGACTAPADDATCAMFHPATPHCDVTADASSGQCVACNANADCKNPTPSCAAHACVACASASGCAGHGSATICAGGSCVQCLTAADCSASAPVCANGTCAGCSSSAECSRFLLTPACNPGTGGCVLCTTGAGGDAAACASNPDGHACQTGSSGVFCGCAVDADCGSATSGRICDGVTRLCVDGCARAPGRNNCPPDRFCTSNSATAGSCTVGCDFDVDCASMPNLPLCKGGGAGGPVDGGGGVCVGCLTSTDCGGSKPICDPVRAICVECTSASHAACTSGGKGASCLANGTCGCKSDGDCGNLKSGRICDFQSHLCAPGCRTGSTGCPSGLVCMVTSGGVGTCVVPMPDLGAPDLGARDLSVAPDLSAAADAGGRPDLSGLQVSGGGGCALGAADAPAGPLAILVLLLGTLALLRRRTFTR